MGVCRDSIVVQVPQNCNPFDSACSADQECRQDTETGGFFCLPAASQGAGSQGDAGSPDLSRFISPNQPQCQSGWQAIVDLNGNQQTCWSNSHCTRSQWCMGMTNTDAGICCSRRNTQPSVFSAGASNRDCPSGYQTPNGYTQHCNIGNGHQECNPWPQYNNQCLLSPTLQQYVCCRPNPAPLSSQWQWS